MTRKEVGKGDREAARVKRKVVDSENRAFPRNAPMQNEPVALEDRGDR